MAHPKQLLGQKRIFRAPKSVNSQQNPRIPRTTPTNNNLLNTDYNPLDWIGYLECTDTTLDIQGLVVSILVCCECNILPIYRIKYFCVWAVEF
jgi:hypothetical protein